MLKRFEYWAGGKKVRLEILEKVSETKLIVNVTVDKDEIANNATATICKVNNKPGKLYLNLNNTFLTICDKSKAGSVERNRQISDWIWENIQDKDHNSLVYGFTTHHWQNWEGN